MAAICPGDDELSLILNASTDTSQMTPSDLMEVTITWMRKRNPLKNNTTGP